ncbi:MAG: radical SAM protein [Candidatus Marinimicrobia bacterium]|nr:radical SAM protein [Candidatus Neomarinimicrobiota bacterium]
MVPRKNLLRAIKKALAQPEYALINLFHRLMGVGFYHLSNGKSYYPETISLFLTFKCNLRCFMCGQWGEDGAFKNFSKSVLKLILTKEDVERTVKDVKMHKTNFTLFGGEPMLHPDWIEIVKIIKGNGLRCNIVTNGTLIKKYAVDIVNSGIDEIIFSLDGPEEIHDKIRRVPGTFKKTIEGFKYLNNLKKKYGKKKPVVNINTTINELNYKNLEEIIKVAESIGTKMITFHHLLFLKKHTVINFINFFEKKFGQKPTDWIGFAYGNPVAIDAEYLISQIETIKQKKYNIGVSFFPNLSIEEIRDWYSGGEFISKTYKNRCMSLWMTAYIFPDGSIRPYHTMNYTIGNIRHNSFRKIWNSKKYTEYRAYIKKVKKFPVCSKGCTEFFRY